jgi:iron complex outermembrane recepter protein
MKPSSSGIRLIQPVQAFCLAVGMLFHLVAEAQVLEEVVVTAQKREQSLQDVGISVTAFSGEQIRALGFEQTLDLAAHTPGLVASGFSGDPNISLFAIRGVGQNDFADHHESPNAIYVDGAYVGAMGASGFQMFDLDRVEVLRGPQGTLYGRNATGGLIHFISRKPTREFDAYGDVTVAAYSQVRFEGAIGGPLGEKLSTRASVASNYHDGWMKNRIGGDIHEAANLSGRVQLQFEPHERASMNLKVHAALDDKPNAGTYQHRASVFGPDGLGQFLPDDVNADLWGLGSCPGCDPLGYRDTDGDPHAGDFSTTGNIDRDVWGVSGNLEWEFVNGLALTSITDYYELDKTYLEDSDGSPNPLMIFYTGQDTQQFSQELRLSGESERLRWVAGLYYLNIDGEYSSRLDVPLFLADQRNDWVLDTTSWAIFSQAEIDLTPHWTVIGGLRWTEDEKEYEFNPRCLGAGCLGFFLFPGLGTVGEVGFSEATAGDLTRRDDGDYSAKFELDWRPREGLLVYTGVTRGNKAGGFSAPLDALLLPVEMTYKPEVLTSYEAGIKAQFFDGRLRYNSSAFYYDYEDFQAFNFSGLTQVVVNADAEIKGIEAEIVLLPTDDLELMLGLSLLDAKVSDIAMPSGQRQDQDMAQAPEVTVNGLVRKMWPFWNGDLFAQLDFFYSSEQVFNTVNHPTAYADSYLVANGRVGYTTADGRWEVAAFGRNIADEEYKTYAFDVSGFGYSASVFGPPRWIGAQIRYNWR